LDPSRCRGAGGDGGYQSRPRRNLEGAPGVRHRPHRTMVDADAMEIEPAAVKAGSKPPPSKIGGSPAPSRADAKSTASLMWVEKYRPRGLEDLLSHTAIIQTLRKLIASNRMPHVLFHGPPGTGKTSTILACAREMYGASFRSMVLELNASDDRGIDVVRDQIKSFASTKRIFSSGVKLIILDEADAMTSAAQAALRRVVEKYVGNTRFCLICNYVNKITPALQSRCTKFRFGPLPPESIRARAEFVAEEEGVKLAPGAIDALLQLSQGDMRRVLNILQSTHMAVSPAPVTADSFYSNTGDPHPRDVAALFDALLAKDAEFADCSRRIANLKAEKGVALGDLIEGLTACVTAAPPTRIPAAAKIYIYQQLAACEHRLSLGANENINTGAIVGAFTFAAAMT
jgi:replication factor C subunit 3/5